MKLLLATFFFVKLKIFQIEFNNFCSDINVLMDFYLQTHSRCSIANAGQAYKLLHVKVCTAACFNMIYRSSLAFGKFLK